MSVEINYKDAPVYKYFESICNIPHGSGNEKAIADYVEGFARERGLYAYRDSFDNVFIRREASAGYEQRPAVLLQGHLDMVCEKIPELEFDFLKDAIQIEERDGCLYAKGTTLGADDGAAVAVMLAILDDKDYKGPVIECLFTTSEETALVGATNFDYSKVTARRMINIDTECEGEAVAGSAGGVRCRITRDIETEDIGEGVKTALITVGGLKGGHSGTDIGLGRLSACVAMSKLLKLLGDRITLVSIVGGNMDNAIARDCTAEVVCTDTEAVRAVASDFEAMLKAKINEEDSGLFITVDELEDAECAYTKDSSDAVIAFANELVHGVYAMSRDREGLVESSANFASFKKKDGKLLITMSMR
ncbi:MAG: M20/M25/M40 family metallo-hydrolase, partial [Clostridia bacterium]|nr:M20/M25/M40 family metallo-hydrolase [Clostridia bacterium]